MDSYIKFERSAHGATAKIAEGAMEKHCGKLRDLLEKSGAKLIERKTYTVAIEDGAYKATVWEKWSTD